MFRSKHDRQQGARQQRGYRVGKQNQINGSEINVLIAVDVLIAIGSEFQRVGPETKECP